MSTFNPTPAEMALTMNIFNAADPQKLGIVTGDTAVKILAGANLSHIVLGEVWAIADKENNGFLTRKGVAVALRLIGHAQKGEPVNEELLSKPGPLAHIDGVSGLAAVGSQTPPSALKSSLLTFPPLTLQDKAKFLILFMGCGPVNGLLSGEKARDVFVKSKLPYERLSQIWTLSDTKTRGALDSTDFTIGMYLIQASMSSNNFILPATLPTWVYEQAMQQDAAATVTNHATGASASGFVSPLQSRFQVPGQFTGSGADAMTPQYTGQGQTFSQIPSQVAGKFSPSSPAPLPPVSVPPRGFPAQSEQWEISAEAKRASDQFFDSLDTQQRGYIEGAVAVPFLLESKLPEDDLARIWDLSVLHNDGRLTREGFAVAMHLINARLTGAQIPAVLPASLMPAFTKHPQSSMMGAINQPQPDLLGDDTPPSTAVPLQSTGSSVTSPSTSGPAISNHSTDQASFQGAFVQSRRPSAFLPAGNRDLLGDDDEESSKSNAVPEHSVEIGNLQNQVASTTRSHFTIRAERISAEQTVTQQASQLSQLQNQLSAAKASYETESRLLANLHERLAAQRIDIEKTRMELIEAESELSGAKVEKAEVEGSILRDKEDVRELQRKMRDVMEECDILKSSIEKARKDARQQKGLLAIAKKQLATAEAEKLKTSKELDVAYEDLDSTRKERDDIEVHVASLETIKPLQENIHADGIANPAAPTFAAGIPLPGTPQPATPQSPARRQSTNPFTVLAMTSAAMSENSSFPIDTLKSETATLLSDPFGFSTNPATTLFITPAQPSPVPEDGIEVLKADINSAPAVDSAKLPPFTLSPSDNDLPFLTPRSTATPIDRRNGSPVSQGEHHFPEAFPLDTQNDLKPLQEVENNGSDTSDGDDELPGPKISSKLEQAATGIISIPTVSSEPTQGVGSPYPTFEDPSGGTDESITSFVATRTPTTSGKSSPRRGRSPGRALSTRTLSSHSIIGAMDPFGGPTFSRTPLEPSAGEAAPPPTIETVLEPNLMVANASSINDFDEALGKVPSTVKDPATTFKFDSAFDDNFDFTSALRESMGTSPLNDNGVDIPGSSSNMGTTFGTFPSVSGIENRLQLAPSAIPEFSGEVFNPQQSPVNGGQGPVVSFDDAFGLNIIEQPHSNGQLVTSNGNVPPKAAAANGTSQIPLIATKNPSPLSSSSPLPARTQPSPPPARERSPPIRPASPPPPRASMATPNVPPPPLPRASSPKLRGSKGSPENKSDTPPKHKLSIRFPFGRKDKAKDKEDKRAQSQAHHQLPEQQQVLSAVPEPQTPDNVTPAIDDDAEPVKQLAAMGFSRTRSIAALEIYGYDMQKALNSLLGAA